MNSAPHDYALCGWRLRSAIALPELGPWQGDDRAPELVFELGEVPARLDNIQLRTPVVQVDDSGTIRFAIDGVADYLVRGGNHVIIAPVEPAAFADIRLFLLGTGLGYLCHQRGILPVHAAALEVDGGAVLIAGASGAGKSTLASAFVRRGHRMLSDDVAPLDMATDPVTILPGIRRIRLWRDSADKAEWPLDAIEPCRVQVPKFSRSLDLAHVDKALIPSAIFHLHAAAPGDTEIAIERIRGVDAVKEMRSQIYRWRTLAAIQGYPGAFQRVSAGAEAIPRHFNLVRPMRYSRLDETVDAIIDAVRTAA